MMNFMSLKTELCHMMLAPSSALLNHTAQRTQTSKLSRAGCEFCKYSTITLAA